MQATRRRSHGFTLVELLIVCLIIVVLISILIPTVSKVRQSVQVANTKNQLQQIVGAIERYYGDQHQYPGPLESNQYLQLFERYQGNPPAGVPQYPLYDATVDTSGNTPLTRA